MVSVVRIWGGEECPHDCSMSLSPFPPKKSETGLLLEQQVLRVHRGSCRVFVHAGLTIESGYCSTLVHSETSLGTLCVSWVLLPVFAEQQQGGEE